MIRTEGLEQGYGGRTVFSGLNIRFREGVCGLLGPNGAGKTTLLKTLATIIPPRRGSLEVCGSAIDSDRAARRARRDIGYLPQDFGFTPGFSVFGHLAGTWSSGRFLAPVSTALATFVVIAWLGRGLGLFVLNGAPDLAPVVPAVLWRVAAAVAAVILAVTVSRPRGAVRWSRGRLRLAAGISALAFAATLAGAGSAGAVQAPRNPPASAETACTGGHPSLCLWPEDEKYLPQARAMASRLQVLQAEGIEVSDTYFERGLRGSDPNGLDFYILEGSLWDPAETIGGEIGHNTITAACSLRSGTNDPSGLQAAGELNMWLAMRVFGGGQPGDMHGGPPDVDLSAVAGLLHESESAQLQWYQERLAMARRAFCG